MEKFTLCSFDKEKLESIAKKEKSKIDNSNYYIEYDIKEIKNCFNEKQISLIMKNLGNLSVNLISADDDPLYIDFSNNQYTRPFYVTEIIIV